jgi:hypothetical protein
MNRALALALLIVLLWRVSALLATLGTKAAGWLGFALPSGRVDN